MALENLIKVSFTEEDISKLKKSLSEIEEVLAPKVVNLTPDERRQYGRIGNNTQNWIDKVDTYMVQNPKLVPFYLSKEEFDKDRLARSIFLDLIKQTNSILESMEDTGMLLSTDIYHNALAFYQNVRLAANQNVPGSTSIYQDLAEQFPGRPASVTGEPVPGAEVYVEQEDSENK